LAYNVSDGLNLTGILLRRCVSDEVFERCDYIARETLMSKDNPQVVVGKRVPRIDPDRLPVLSNGLIEEAFFKERRR